jgi:paraquat-inducible protein B
MSKMANKSLVGAFVIGAVVLAVIAVIIFGSGKFFQKIQTYVVYFQGSVKGLNVGSPVIFRGVKIGEVKSMAIRFQQADLTFYLPVIIEIEVDKFRDTGMRPTKPYEYYQGLIDKGLRAQLQSLSFVTGQLAVAVDFFPDKPAKFVGLDKRYHEIPTVPTMLEDLTKSFEKLHLEELVESVKSTVTGIDKLVNSPEIAKTLQSLSQAAEEAKMLVKNVNGQIAPLTSQATSTLKDAQILVKNLDEKITPLLVSVDGAVKDAQKLVQHVDGRIDPVVSNVEETLKGVNSLVRNDVPKLVRNIDQKVEQISPEVVKSLETLRGTLQEAQTALRSVSSSATPDSVLIYQMTEALSELSNAARSLRDLSGYIERHPESFIRGKKNP